MSYGQNSSHIYPSQKVKTTNIFLPRKLSRAFCPPPRVVVGCCAVLSPDCTQTGPYWMLFAGCDFADNVSLPFLILLGLGVMPVQLDLHGGLCDRCSACIVKKRCARGDQQAADACCFVGRADLCLLASTRSSVVAFLDRRHCWPPVTRHRRGWGFKCQLTVRPCRVGPSRDGSRLSPNPPLDLGALHYTVRLSAQCVPFVPVPTRTENHSGPYSY